MRNHLDQVFRIMDPQLHSSNHRQFNLPPLTMCSRVIPHANKFITSWNGFFALYNSTAITSGSICHLVGGILSWQVDICAIVGTWVPSLNFTPNCITISLFSSAKVSISQRSQSIEHSHFIIPRHHVRHTRWYRFEINGNGQEFSDPLYINTISGQKVSAHFRFSTLCRKYTEVRDEWIPHSGRSLQW